MKKIVQIVHANNFSCSVHKFYLSTIRSSVIVEKMKTFFFLVFIFQSNAWPPIVEKSPYRTVTTAYRQVELYHVQDEHMEIIVAEQLCKEAGMYLPDPMDVNESMAIFRDKNEELILYESNTGLQRVSDTSGGYFWMATSNQRRPELFWAIEKDLISHEKNAQWFPTPRENFGLCLRRDYVVSGGSALNFDVCDRRVIAFFLCENDDLDFAFRTFLNDSQTGFDAFLGSNLTTSEYFNWLKSFNFANYVEVNLTNYWNAMIENQVRLTNEEKQILLNRKPRIIRYARQSQ